MPARERVLEIHAAVADFGQRPEQVGDRRPSARLTAACSSGGFGKLATDPAQLPGGTAEREFDLLGGQEIPVHRVIGVDADAAVHVHDGVCHSVPGVGGPERRGGHVDFGGEIFGDPPGRLGQRQPQPLDVDIPVGQPLSHRLEAADRAIELLTGAGILGRHLQSALEHPELKRAAAQRGNRAEPGDDFAAADLAGRVDLGRPPAPDARRCPVRSSRAAVTATPGSSAATRKTAVPESVSAGIRKASAAGP